MTQKNISTTPPLLDTTTKNNNDTDTLDIELYHDIWARIHHESRINRQNPAGVLAYFWSQLKRLPAKCTCRANAKTLMFELFNINEKFNTLDENKQLECIIDAYREQNIGDVYLFFIKFHNYVNLSLNKSLYY